MADLRSATLSLLSDNVVIPQYDRDATLVGIVHIGLGGFGRSHLAMYLDAALSAGGDAGWGVAGVGLMPADERMRDTLSAQDGLYTLVTRAPENAAEIRIIGSVVDYAFAPDNPERVLDLLTRPSTRIVSLTITESGYGIDDATGRFDLDRAGARDDISHPRRPVTAWGFLAESLRRRREAGIAPFTVLSCDNIQANGETARVALAGFAAHLDPELAQHIATDVAFPNSMVDRITPATTPEDIADVESLTGVRDAWPVTAEQFAQWVVEDNFPAGRPALDQVGVQFVDDVAPYEKMKLRLLNASHQAMGYLGILAGFTMVHDVACDAAFAGFLADYMRLEAEPTLDPVAGVDVRDYEGELLTRFSNPAIADTLGRLVVDSSDRLAKFLAPVIADLLAAGAPIDRAALVLAAWQACALRGARNAAERVLLHDRDLTALEAAALADEDRPGSFLDAAPGWPLHDARLSAAYVRAKVLLADRGARGAIIALAASAE